MPFDFAQDSVRQVHQERNQHLVVRGELAEGLVKLFHE